MKADIIEIYAALKEHQVKQGKLKEINDQNKKAAIAATESVVNLMTDSVGESVADVFVAEKKLEKETKGLQTNTAHFARQTHQWLDMIKQFNTSLKDVGDFQNWAKTVEWDMRNIASALDYVAKSEKESAAAAGAYAPASSSEFPAAS